MVCTRLYFQRIDQDMQLIRASVSVVNLHQIIKSRNKIWVWDHFWVKTWQIVTQSVTLCLCVTSLIILTPCWCIPGSLQDRWRTCCGGNTLKMDGGWHANGCPLSRWACPWRLTPPFSCVSVTSWVAGRRACARCVSSYTQRTCDDQGQSNSSFNLYYIGKQINHLL